MIPDVRTARGGIAPVMPRGAEAVIYTAVTTPRVSGPTSLRTKLLQSPRARQQESPAVPRNGIAYLGRCQRVTRL